ncbi:MAG: 4Fe-4S binding protein [Tannerella sp.]|nr:4Fe-4S binding protein [Tannerella sp.]
MKVKERGYIGGILNGIWTLIIGLKVTFIEFFTKKTTQQYPENRATLVMFDRFRGSLKMDIDDQGRNRCTACGLCEMNCPNNTISVESELITDSETGKKKKVLTNFRYNLGSCMFCLLCVNACPADAIAFDQNFEHAVYQKIKLEKVLNKV